MKKQIVTLALILCLITPSFASAKSTFQVNNKENMLIAIIGTALAYWSFIEEDTHGFVFGSLCTITVSRRILEW